MTALNFSRSAAIPTSATPTCGSAPTVTRTVSRCALSTRSHPPDAHYNSVKNVLRHYIGYRQAQGGDADTDNAGDLLGTFGELGGPQEWAAMTNNRKPTSTAKGAPLKAAAIHEAADRLRERGIDSTDDLRATTPDELEHTKKAWITLPGQRSGITWNYFLMLAAFPV